MYPSHSSPPSRIGEVWLTADDNRVANGAWSGKTLADLCRTHPAALLGTGTQILPGSNPSFPLLVKFLFTSGKLSVQVHPSDAYAKQKEESAGKTEMWHVLKAEPGARLAIGFQEAAIRSLERNALSLRDAVESGAIEGMLHWMDARAGDTFFVPAGTVHAIGAGLVLCEIQQNSDITYRLYDYNRPGVDGHPRPLHLEKALDVLQWETSGGRTEPVEFPHPEGSRILLAACPYFATEKLKLTERELYRTEGRYEIWIGLEGAAELESASQRSICRPGEAVLVPAAVETFSVNPVSPCVFLRTYQPDLDSVVASLRSGGCPEQQLRRVCFSG